MRTKNVGNLCVWTRLEGPYTFARKVYKPLAKQVIADMELRHTENTSTSRYVWLPIEWDGGKPVLRWRDEWKWGNL